MTDPYRIRPRSPNDPEVMALREAAKTSLEKDPFPQQEPGESQTDYIDRLLAGKDMG